MEVSFDQGLINDNGKRRASASLSPDDRILRDKKARYMSPVFHQIRNWQGFPERLLTPLPQFPPIPELVNGWIRREDWEGPLVEVDQPVQEEWPPQDEWDTNNWTRGMVGVVQEHWFDLPPHLGWDAQNIGPVPLQWDFDAGDTPVSWVSSQDESHESSPDIDRVFMLEI